MSETKEKAVKGLFEYTEDELRQGLRPGTYHVRVTEAAGGSWDEAGNDPRLDIRTQVVSGEYANQFGPNHTWSISEFTWEGDGEREGFTKSRAQNVETFARQVVYAVHGGRELSLTVDNTYDVAMLSEIARQLKGNEFIATVVEDKNGYPKISRFYSMERPPKGFRQTVGKKRFSL